MTITEKLKQETGISIHLYKEGVFWIAYEQSAYMLCGLKPLKVTKRYIKAAKCEIIKVGFPASVLSQFYSQLGEPEQTEEHYIRIKLDVPIKADEFTQWKEQQAVSIVGANNHSPIVIKEGEANDEHYTYDINGAGIIPGIVRENENETGAPVSANYRPPRSSDDLRHCDCELAKNVIASGAKQQEAIHSSHEIIDKIASYPLAEHTPMDVMNFLQTIKLQISNTI